MEESREQATADVLNSLDIFIANNQSTSPTSAMVRSGINVGITPTTIAVILFMRGVTMLEPLSPERWDEFCSKITHPLDPAESEVRRVHPLLCDVMAACMPARSDLNLRYEAPFENEDSIVSKPGMTIIMVNVFSRFGGVVGGVAVPIEVTKLNDRIRAIHQALGYLVGRLRAQAMLVDIFDTELWGYCVGFDGERIIVGYAELVKLKFQVLHTGGSGIMLWPLRSEDRTIETFGVRVLRSLFSATPAVLGMEPPVQVLPGTSIQLDSLLGRGAFCTTYAAHDVTKPNAIFALKVTSMPIAMNQARPDAAQHINNEMQALARLAAPSTVGIPRLLSPEEAPSSVPTAPCVLSWPVGVPLIVYISAMRKPQRQSFAAALAKDLLAALAYAEQRGLCHSDIRPDNVVIADNRGVLIDWGLARAPTDAMHPHRGGLPFFHDDLVMYHDLAWGQTPTPPTFLPAYDQASVRYVVHVVAAGYKRLMPPWVFDSGEDLIRLRDEALQVS